MVRVKVEGAQNLDSACRNFPQQISTFVCFSSIVAAFGNAGQCSYGYANSSLDSICRNRVEDGLPAVSIQWGLIDAGMGVSVKQVSWDPLTVRCKKYFSFVNSENCLAVAKSNSIIYFCHAVNISQAYYSGLWLSSDVDT